MTLSMSSVTGNAERRHTTRKLPFQNHSAMQPNARIDAAAMTSIRSYSSMKDTLIPLASNELLCCL
jgi:hypothetical protein